MNQLQQTELELLRAFDRVCAQLDVPYFLVCGSALGAVKYGGFIPWDDDIDVAMYREHYEKFVSCAPALLEEGMFLQNFRSEARFPQIYSKLRNSNTTYIEKSAAHIPMNHGVFLDIFPLDGYPKAKWQKKKLEFFKRLYTNMLLSAYEIPRGRRSGMLCGLWRMLGLHRNPGRAAGAYERMIRRYPPEDSELVCNHGNWQGVLDYTPAAWFGEGCLFCFEGLLARVPERYDEYLTRKYGNWREDPSEEGRVGHHYYTVCDCTRPYTDYLGE